MIEAILLTLAITLFATLIAMSRIGLALHRDLRTERQQRSRWAQLFASARRWEDRRRQAALYEAEARHMRRLRTGPRSR